jgi:hypothetical protein
MTWPLAQGTIQYLDVGNVYISSPTGQLISLVKDATGSKDFFDRPHDLWYKKLPVFTANDGDTYLPPNEAYKIEFTGSSDWPAQAINNVAFMPAAWTPISPASNTQATLLADTDFVTTYNVVASTNLPSGANHVNTIVAFTANGLGAAPAFICQLDGLPGQLTVPAAVVNALRVYGGGNMVRVNVSHQLVELTDGTPVPADQRKRLDLVAFYCFIQPWVAG